MKKMPQFDAVGCSNRAEDVQNLFHRIPFQKKPGQPPMTCSLSTSRGTDYLPSMGE